MKKVVKVILISIFIVLSIVYYRVEASDKKYGIDSFPASYQGYLRELSKKHSNWTFVALYTNLDWNYVINEENIYGKNLVPKNYSDSWKNTLPGQYDIEIDSGWVDSSRQAVEYCMDPRNFLNEGRIFQFEVLSYEPNNSLEGIEKILYGTEFYNKKVSYLDSMGNTINMNENYSKLMLRAAQTSLVSPYHLASRIKQEVGPFLSHASISGNVEGFEGYYNFYNIGATSAAEPMVAIRNGLQYAKDGKSASESIRNRYLIPWNTKERAITGGAIFIGSSYINVGQNTVYLQKFDINNDRNGVLFTHQYMTNVLAPMSEAKSIYKAYEKIGFVDTEITFVIPVFDNMPNIPTQSPNIDSNDFVQDNTKVYCNATNVNIRTGPSTSYEIIMEVSNPIQMTRIAKGVQLGERWDEVVFDNGIVGYIYQTYLSEVQAENADIEFDSDLQVNSLEISGIYYNENRVIDIKDKIRTNLEVQIANYENQILSDTDLVGTGSKVQFKENGIIVREYKIIIYGDSNGDGKINSVDLLVLQRHILEISRLDDIFQKASNIAKNGKAPTSIDLLLIQRHILGIQNIRQRED